MQDQRPSYLPYPMHSRTNAFPFTAYFASLNSLKIPGAFTSYLLSDERNFEIRTYHHSTIQTLEYNYSLSSLESLYLVTNQLLTSPSFLHCGRASCFQPRKHSYRCQYWSHTRNKGRHFDQQHSTGIFPVEVEDQRSGNLSSTIAHFAVSTAQFLEFGISRPSGRRFSLPHLKMVPRKDRELLQK